MKTATTFNIFLIIVLAFTAVSAQEVPQFIHYQGNLAQTNGNPVNDNLLMFFRIFDVEEGGTALWEEVHNAVTVEDGLFNVLLGSIDSVNNPLTSALFSGKRYLEIQIGQEILLPRQKIGSTPFAFTSSASLSTRGIEVNSAGNVGIGTTNPDGKLVINGSATSTPSSDPSFKITGVGTGSMMTMGLRFSGADAWIQSNGHLLLQPEPGNVGIGTSNPQATLDVKGSIRTAAGQAFVIRYGTGTVNLDEAANRPPPHFGIFVVGFQFGYAFSQPPTVIVSGNSFGNWRDAIVPSAIGITTSGFNLAIFNSSNNVVSKEYRFSWIAIGL